MQCIDQSLQLLHSSASCPLWSINVGLGAETESGHKRQVLGQETNQETKEKMLEMLYTYVLESPCGCWPSREETEWEEEIASSQWDGTIQ